MGTLTTILLMALFQGAGEDPGSQFVPGSVALQDGGKLAYYVREGPGPALVLIPGSWGGHDVFDETVPALDPALRLIVVEMRGCGESWPPASNASIELFAEDILRVVDALGLKRFYVGGHSIGGMIPIEVVKQRPEAVAGAIAIEGWTQHRVEKEAFGGPQTLLTPEQEAKRSARRALAKSRMTPEQFKSFGTAWQRWDGLPILEMTDVPILEIWGDRARPKPDRKTMRIPERPNIELVWMEGASHPLLIERPKEVASAINAFIAKTEAASGE
ncbi:MAG: alpha/beta hydrolase [FCB group bacterium]|jgi:pimeloyl-ACP methyl ester carboxylesterase|nr:alpha/beta hydrolase [FCB group bacterium]